MEGQYVIIDLRNMDFMKDEEGKISYYDTIDEAYSICGMYEFKNAWVMQLMHNHIEGTEFCDWMTDSGYKDEQNGTMKKGNKRYCINNLFKHYQNLLELTPKDAEVFFNEIMNPKEANKALKKAMLKFITR